MATFNSYVKLPEGTISGGSRAGNSPLLFFEYQRVSSKKGNNGNVDVAKIRQDTRIGIRIRSAEIKLQSNSLWNLTQRNGDRFHRHWNISSVFGYGAAHPCCDS